MRYQDRMTSGRRHSEPLVKTSQNLSSIREIEQKNSELEKKGHKRKQSLPVTKFVTQFVEGILPHRLDLLKQLKVKMTFG